MADEEPTTDEEDSGPWGTLGFGLLLIAAGIGAYFYFGYLEQRSDGGSVRMNAILLILYTTLGKTGVLAVLSGIGSLMAIFGIRGILQERNS